MRSVRRNLPISLIVFLLVAVVIALGVYYSLPYLGRLAEGFADCSSDCLKCTTEPGYLEAHSIQCDSCAKSCPTQHAPVGAAGPHAEPRESEQGY